MNTLRLSLIACLLVFSGTAHCATITFGTDDYVVDTNASTFSISSQNATSLTLSGSAQSDLYGSLINSIDLSAYVSGSGLSVALTASTTSTSDYNFTLELFDADGDGVKYTGNWSSFTDSLSSVSLTLAGYDLGGGGVFDGVVSTIAIYGGGSTAALNITLGSLTFDSAAVPEPASCAALAGFATLGAALCRRRRLGSRR
ncbi:MAG: hypothetical protein WC661_09155 [Opitutaceae bacterium]|jgi:hypothetical protein